MRKMANVVVIVLSVTIGLFFILIGTIKLTPAINEEVYKEMVIMNIYLYLRYDQWFSCIHTNISLQCSCRGHACMRIQKILGAGNQASSASRSEAPDS